MSITSRYMLDKNDMYLKANANVDKKRQEVDKKSHLIQLYILYIKRI